MTAAARTEPTPGTAVAPAKEKSAFVAMLESNGSRIEGFLPEGVKLDRVIAAVRLEAMKNPAILECTPQSLVQSIARIQQWGLEIGVTAYLVPFKDRKKEITEAVAVMGYTGMVELMVQSGAVRHVQARCVYEHDEFAYQMGLDEQLRHVPVGDPKKRGALIGAYCIFRLRGGDVFEFMSIEDIEAIRQKYSKQWNEKMVGACPPWYAKKTVVRQAAKLVPKNPRLARAMEAIDADFEITPDVDDDRPSLPSGAASRTLPDDDHPRPLMEGGYEQTLPLPPAQHSDDPAQTAEDTELALDDLKPVRRGQNAIREG